jgi:MFS family permease
VYQIDNRRPLLQSLHTLPTQRWRHISRTVLLLGLTSFFTDISSEMVSTILPLYMLYTLQMAPLSFGILDGLYQGTASLVRIASGYLADRGQRYKEVAVAGYALSALCKPGILLAGSAFAPLAGLLVIDRIGKGIRTAPRDAMISFSSPPAELATAFGMHRALDTAGAMLGPLVAFGLLSLAPHAFDAIFVVSFCIALIGLGVLTLFVPPQQPDVTPAMADRISLRAACGLVQLPHFRLLLLLASGLSLATISDGFVYLSLQRRMHFSFSLFPLLYAITALIFMLLAIPVGRLADRVGRHRVFLGGYALLVLVYLALLLPSAGGLDIWLTLPLFGAYYAATDGVLVAQASALLPAALRGSGLALLSTITGLSRLLASLLFGLFWTWWGVQVAIIIFTIALALLVILCRSVQTRKRIDHADSAGDSGFCP